MSEIPTTFYIILGVMVVMNLTSIITMMTFIFKAGQFVASTEAGIKEAQGTGNRAHQRIDQITKESLNGN